MKPTHNLCMKSRAGKVGSANEKWSTIGVGWLNKPDGGSEYVSITLNRGVVLSWRDGEDMKLALFEVKK